MDSATRARVRRRGQKRCEYCHLPDHADAYAVFHVEHIVAQQHGGGDEIENLAWACSRCNRKKGTNLASVDEQSNQQVNLFRPRQDQWDDHFTVRGGLIVGLTPVGRATVRLLEMNVPARVRLRRQLVEQGEFN